MVDAPVRQIPQTTYNYAKTEDLCKTLKLFVDWPAIEHTDGIFKQIGLTQDQVDAVMREHIIMVRFRLLNPDTYTLRNRILLGLFFLFGLS